MRLPFPGNYEPDGTVKRLVVASASGTALELAAVIFLIYRCNHGAPQGASVGGIKPSFLGVFDGKENVLWSAGPRRYNPRIMD